MPMRNPDGRETRDAPVLSIRAAVQPSTLDEEARTVDVTWSTGAEVQRVNWWTGNRWTEALSMKPAHVRLGRLNSGAPVLDSHSSWRTGSVLGVVESARIEEGKGVATLRFSKREEAETVFRDIKDGILRNISVGYVVHKWQDLRNAEGKLEKRTAMDWEPYELSVVPIPADAGAQVRALEDDTADDGRRGADMAEQADNTPGAPEQRSQPETPAVAPPVGPTPEETRAAERKRIAAIVELCRQHGVSDEQRDKWIGEGTEVDAVRAGVLADIVRRQDETRVIVAPGDGRREQAMAREAADCLLRRAGESVEGDGYRNFGEGSLLRIAEAVLGAGGVNTRSLDKNELAKRALGTADFTSILSAVGTRLVRAGYDAFPMAHRVVFRRATASDFRQKHRPVVAAGSILPKVPEHGPIPRLDAKAEMASYAIDTYAGVVSITRKLIINDDFDFVASVSRQRGRSAAETERKTVWDFITQASFAGPTAPDGNACFDNTNHGNFPAASATPISATTLAAARTALRTATSPDGLPINATLRHVVVSSVGETDFDQLLNGMYVPTAQSTAMTPTLRSVQLHVEPLISSTKAHWYGFADYNQVDTFEYAYLAGSEGPRVEQRMGFEVEGIELKVALDFGVGCIDHRGTFMQRES